MKLRFATEEDSHVLEGVHAKAFDAAWTAADIARLMQIMGGFALIAEDDARKGSVIGFILARSLAGEAEILTLAVAPRARRKRVASDLVEAVAEEAQRRGAFALFLEVAADNPAALALYQGLGFGEAGQRRAYYARRGGPAVDALVLRRALNRPTA